METAPLKSFATSARTELIREVSARITAVLAQGSPERVEQPKAVTALERAIAGGGGGDRGKAHVADKVAYTWFNRIIALRFMDATGYTGIGVVSPAADQVGQPEVLSAAKRGQVDQEVVKGTNPATIAGLLNGTRQPHPGADGQAEAYALLLADYCRFWNKAMPFMFERAGDFTELLIPGNLLADDSVLHRAVNVLTADVCQDVEVIGWLYQFYISERKDEVFAGFKKNKKAGADEIPAATQLFTPHWIVRYLVENSLGRLWMRNRPASRLVSQMAYYIEPVDEVSDFLKINKPEELTVIDPACGSGHMLSYAFDLLYAIYEEEGYAPSEIPRLILANNLYGTEIDPRAGALAAFALMMKARARRRTFFSDRVEPNICVLDPIRLDQQELDFLCSTMPKVGLDRDDFDLVWNTFEHADVYGSLIQPAREAVTELRHAIHGMDSDEIIGNEALRKARLVISQADYLTNRYAVVVANPPYMGSGNMGAQLSAFAKEHYANGKQDLYGCFILRAMDLAASKGLVAKVVGDTWMSIVSFKDLREEILSGHSFDSFVHLRDVSNHPDIFGANAAFVVAMANTPGHHAPFIRLTTLNEEEKRLRLIEAIRDAACEWRFSACSEDLAKVPGSPIAYWLSDSMRSVFDTTGRLNEKYQIREGLTSGKNDRYLRYWWEVSADRALWTASGRKSAAGSNARWFPHRKGGPFRRWYGNQEFVINWEDDGAEIKAAVVAQYGGSYTKSIRSEEWYFKPALSWGLISSGEFSLREYPAGQLFDSASPCLFVNSAAGDRELAWMNSSSVGALLAALSPTLHFRLTPVGNLPIPRQWVSIDPQFARQAVEVARADWDDFETSWAFAAPSWLRGAASCALRERLAEWSMRQAETAREQQAREVENNRIVAEAYGLQDEVSIEVPLHRVSLTRNVEFNHGPGKTPEAYAALELAELMRELISYAVGCMLGRFSLGESGLILADQGATLQDFLSKVPTSTFTPDSDNVIPVVDGDWFEDDVVGLFRQFLWVAFGDQHFEENLKFVTESLGVKNLRDYFITRAGKSKFYDDHVQRYKKRPIYWLFSSPKGSFNALVYMHRLTPSSVSTVLTYLREYVTKLESSLQQAERAGNAKEADRLRKILVELNEYEHDTLYPKASQNVAIDLDDGVKTNYPKFGPALRKIAGLEASGE
ncbi:type IIS restriction enzyme [Nocardioides sp. CF8]|uniref:BREX-1 system adenine-specific DNA-methyltransferase PglX n=1 Tax=Nocardioides sp. CF8 TaxID=110319 RepID=UPI0003312732|nr:BREX-1 system adenine-specific DNA-methyltransferase PglX [Nocardioides sp. CF8]EON23678.1 type IIS restriction enzyme [Nocardioides sp. CF8]